MSTNDPQMDALATAVSEKLLSGIRDIVREMMTDVLATSQQPSIIASESGLTSLKLGWLAKGETQPELKMYGTRDGPLADPYTLVETTYFIWDQVLAWRADHEFGAKLQLRRLP